MKFCTIAVVLLISLFATSMALPAKKRNAHYKQARASPQRLVVSQRLVQKPASRTHARSAALHEDCVPGEAASVEQQTAAESIITDSGTNDAEPYPPAGSQVSSEFEGTFADGGVDVGVSSAADVGVSGGADVGVSGGADVPASEIGASVETGDAPELPGSPELTESADLPEAPIVDNQILEDDSVASAAVPEGLPSDDDAKVPREIEFDVPADAVPEAAAAPADTPVEAPLEGSLEGSLDGPVDTPVEAAVEGAVDAAVDAAVGGAVAGDAVPEVAAAPEVPSVAVDQTPVAEAPIGAAAVAPAQVPLAVAASVPAVTKPSAAVPPKRYLPPRKKVSVKLDTQNDDAASYRPARIPNARRPIKASGSTSVGAKANKGTKASKGQLPVGTFFPINFGGTSGGAIAIANSFSTGEGGSATSHAIAYGSPNSARSKVRPARRH